MRLGVFGGTFDPVHLGHLASAEEAAYRLCLPQVLFVPAQHQPLKGAAPRASAADRLAMLRLAVADNPCFDVSTAELDRPAPSYTVDTLRALRAAHGPACELYFLLGVDAANTLADWREPAELLRLARLVVMTRSDVRQPDWAVLRALAPDAAQRVALLAVPDIDLSSSDLRRRVAAGEPIRYQVPEPVRAYIEEHGLYVNTR
jgi:nicotinate-nucleotide adenylyltransferase